MLNGVRNCDVLFVSRTGTGDARTQDLALAANSEPPHQSEHVAVVPGGCWEQEPGDQPPVAWSQCQGHWGQQWQVSALQIDKPWGVDPRHAWWEACVNSPPRDMALALLMSCLVWVAWPLNGISLSQLCNVELHDHQMVFVYPLIYIQNLRKWLLVVRNTMAWFLGEAGDSFYCRLDLPWSRQVCWSFLYLLHETLLCIWWNECFDFGFQVQCRDRHSHRAYARWFGPHHPHATREACRKLHLHCKLCQHRIAVQVGAYQNVWWVLHIKIRLWGNDFFRNNSKWPPDKIVVLRELNYIHHQS